MQGEFVGQEIRHRQDFHRSVVRAERLKARHAARFTWMPGGRFLFRWKQRRTDVSKLSCWWTTM